MFPLRLERSAPESSFFIFLCELNVSFPPSNPMCSMPTVINIRTHVFGFMRGVLPSALSTSLLRVDGPISERVVMVEDPGGIVGAKFDRGVDYREMTPLWQKVH